MNLYLHLVGCIHNYIMMHGFTNVKSDFIVCALLG